MPLALLLATLAAAPPPADSWSQTRALAAHLAEHPCGPRGEGQQGRMAESALLCPVFAGAALVSQAVEQPGRAAEAVALLDPLIEQALAEPARRPFVDTGADAVAGERLPRSVLYRGGLLLLLAGRERLAAGGPRRALLDALATALAGALERQPFLPSFGQDRIWPCDHAPAAAGLVLHGRLRQDAHTAAAGAALLARLEALRAAKGGFATRVDARGRPVEATPRGTATAWTAGFLLHADPGEAGRFAEGFVQGFCQRPLPGLAACREWPAGRPQKADAASGPIVGGFATGSTALGLAAARALPDPGWAAGLLATARAGGIDALLAEPAQAPLEAAIHLWGGNDQPW